MATAFKIDPAQFTEEPAKAPIKIDPSRFTEEQASANSKTMAVDSPAGLIEPGNLDIMNRPRVKTGDGIATVYSTSFQDQEGGPEILIPLVASGGAGVILSPKAAISQYHKTGQHLGKFDTPENATAYAERLHQQQADLLSKPAPIKIDPARFTEAGAVAPPSTEPAPGFLSDLATAGKEAIGDIGATVGRGLEILNNPWNLGRTSDPYNFNDQADVINRATQDVEEQARAADVAAGREFLGTTVRGAGRSIIEGAAMAPAGPYGMIAGAAGIQANQAATEAKDAGLQGVPAARYVAEQAAMEALPAAIMQKVGLGGFEKQMSEAFKGGAKGVAAGLKTMLKDIGLELPEELVTSIGQQISTSKEIEGKNPNEITGEEWARLIRDTTAQTMLAGGVAGAPGLIPQKGAPSVNTTPPEIPGQPTTQAQEPTFWGDYGDLLAPEQSVGLNPADSTTDDLAREFAALQPPTPDTTSAQIIAARQREQLYPNPAQRAPISPVETPQSQVAPEPTPATEVIPQATPEAIPTPTPSWVRDNIDAFSAQAEAAGQSQAIQGLSKTMTAKEVVRTLRAQWPEITTEHVRAIRSKYGISAQDEAPTTTQEAAVAPEPIPQPQPEPPNATPAPVEPAPTAADTSVTDAPVVKDNRITSKMLYAKTPEDFRRAAESVGAKITSEYPWVSTRGDSRVNFTVETPYSNGEIKWQQYAGIEGGFQLARSKTIQQDNATPPAPTAAAPERNFVSNEDGTPKTVYHGTSGSKPITQFEPTETGLPNAAKGVFFTADKAYAQEMADRASRKTGQPARVDSYHIVINNPNPEFASRFSGAPYAENQVPHDGWIGKNGDEYVVFDPSQITPTAETASQIAQPAAEQGQVSAVAPRGIGMRRATPEGRAMVEAAKQQLRDVINNPDIVGRQRGDMLENGKNLIQFLEAHAAHPDKLDIGYERGDKVAYTGMPAEPGFRTFIYLEGANAGKEAVAVTPEQSAANRAKNQSEWRDQQEQFSRLNRSGKEANKTTPPQAGKVDAGGWLFEKGRGYSKDISGYKVEVRSHKNTAKDDKFEAIVNGSSLGRFGSATDAKAYVEANVGAWAEQDLVDQRNAAEEEALAGANAPTTPQAQAAVESTIPGYEPRIDVPPTLTPEQARAKLAKAKSGGEKVSTKTGLTPTQTKVLSDGLREAVGDLPTEAQIKDAPTKNVRTATIEVPGDGRFTVESQEAASAIHQRVTGKPIEGITPSERLGKNAAVSKGYVREGGKGVMSEEERAFYAEQDAKRGPAPADTGIFRDLTAAAREGKRFVEELHVRIAPVLARIHAQAKNAVDFVRQAVAKIGEHVRPYAKRFLADVRKVNAEFAANPTRGSRPKFTSGVFGTGKHPARPDATMKSDQGREGFRYHAKEAAAVIAEWKKAVRPDQVKARAKGFEAAARSKHLTDAGRRKAMERVLDRLKAETQKAEALADVRKHLELPKAEFDKLAPQTQDAINAVKAAYFSRKPTAETIARAQAEVDALAVGFTEEGQQSPKRLEKAQAILAGVAAGNRDLKSLTTVELQNLSAALKKAMQLDKAMKGDIGKRLAEEKLKNDTVAPQEIAAFHGKGVGPSPQVKTREKPSFLDNRKDSWLNLDNLVRGLAGNAGHVYDVLFTRLNNGWHDVNRHAFLNSDILQDMMKKAGLTVDDLKKASPVFAGFEDRGIRKSIVRALKERDTRPITLSNGTTVDVDGGEIIDALNAFKDPDTLHELLKVGAEGFELSRGSGQQFSKMTPEDVRRIAAAATPKERAIADMLFQWSNGPLRDQVNAWSTQNLGYEIFPNKNVWSRMRAMGDREPGQSLLDKGTAQAFVESLNQIQQRTGGNQRIKITDGIQRAVATLNDMSFLMGMYKPAVDARRLLDASKPKAAARDSMKGGAVRWRQIEKRVKDAVSISTRPPDTSMPWVQDLGSRIAAAKLAGNLRVIVSQPFSLLSAAKNIPVKHILANLHPHPYTPKRVAQIKDEIRAARNGLRRVLDSGGFRTINPESQSSLAMGEVFGDSRRDFRDKTMTLVEKANDAALYRIWEAAKAMGREKGLSGKALMDFTADIAEKTWYETQPSDNPFYASGAKLEARTSTWRYMTSMFQGQTSIMFNDAANAVQDLLAKKNPTAADRMIAARSIARAVVLQSLLFAAAGYGRAKMWELLFASDDEKRRKAKHSAEQNALVEFLTGMTTGIIPGGTGTLVEGLAEAARQGLQGDTGRDMSMSPILSTLDQSVRVIRAVSRGRMTPAAWRDLASLIGIAIPAPTENIPAYFEAASKLAE